ncbi:hypothetical protein F511_24805 [Dorcoceras hygrometricum]|uniref:Uncharacterized protein n=1 Tax=Dorcoceras hygrometricum TaxID=472368 RepID=A0A2Z7BDL3_9LAMI|nr:hypothetical protein F511_24805 [Dorcoceras hygrometricum]
MDADVPLDYIEFQIFPSQNRYEACVCHVNKKEKKIASGLLEHLLLHSAEIDALNSKGSDAKYKVKPPEDPRDLKWFTKSTLQRFLHITCSPNMLEITNAARGEMSQLEEARRFHLSLYAKDTESVVQMGETDNNSSYGSSSTPKTEGEASKNELLRAMDLRLTALRGELTAAFDQAVDSRFSVEEMTDLEKFSNHFGSIYLRDSLSKHIELVRNQSVTVSSSKQFLESDGISSNQGNIDSVGSLSSWRPVEYGASPAKVAQIERQSSTDHEESSFSSEEEQTSAERSRSLIRSASPRRSASPMRRIQIGRSGSRRSTAISIKNLNYIPARERLVLPTNPAGSDSDKEGHEQAIKKSENNLRISVQDAINLFERKQRDQIGDIQNARSSLNASSGGNKSVLRRWSSGIGQDSSRYNEESVLDVPQVPSNLKNMEIKNSSPAVEAQCGVSFEEIPVVQCDLGMKLQSPEGTECGPSFVQEETPPIESTKFDQKKVALAEWNRKAEAELNDLMMKMVETKPTKFRTVVPNNSKRRSLPNEQRGGVYDHYYEKRDEKLRGETARRKVEKDKQLRAMQTLDSRRSELALANTRDAGQKQNVKKPQKPQKYASQPELPKLESPKLGSIKKNSVKASSVPATRKSWPSVPSPRASVVSPTKVSTGRTSVGATQARKSHPVSSVSHSSKKVETPQTQPRSGKPNNHIKKSPASTTDKKQNSVTEMIKVTKSKVQPAPGNPVSSAKPSLYSKVTKKGSVVPLESKSFLRKGSGTNSNVNPVSKIKASSQSQEPLMTVSCPILAEENKSVSNSSDPSIQHQENEVGESEVHSLTEPEVCALSPPKCEEKENLAQVYSPDDHVIDRVRDREVEADIEEGSTISPSAWVEIEDNVDHSVASSDQIYEMVSPAFVTPVIASNSRVRHSLSQMLLEENNEPDITDWGNAENPPLMSFQKDVPKGFKRLLKFARKSKNDVNTTGLSSPTVFSEGEEDTDASKFVNKRSAEKLVKKASLQSISNGHSKATHESYPKHPAEAIIGNSNSQSLSQHLHEGYASASVTTTKGQIAHRLSFAPF